MSGAPNTAKKDDGYWAKWVYFTNSLMGTPEWRHNADANRGRDVVGHRREVFLLSAFMLWYYAQMKPRRKADPSAKPDSANKAVQSVRRSHANRGHEMAGAPTIAKALRGLLYFCRRKVLRMPS